MKCPVCKEEMRYLGRTGGFKDYDCVCCGATVRKTGKKAGVKMTRFDKWKAKMRQRVEREIWRQELTLEQIEEKRESAIKRREQLQRKAEEANAHVWLLGKRKSEQIIKNAGVGAKVKYHAIPLYPTQYGGKIGTITNIFSMNKNLAGKRIKRWAACVDFGDVKKAFWCWELVLAESKETKHLTPEMAKTMSRLGKAFNEAIRDIEKKKGRVKNEDSSNLHG